MPVFPESLYLPRRTFKPGVELQTYNYTESRTAAAASIQAPFNYFIVPDEYDYLLTAVNITAQADPAQSVNSIYFVWAEKDNTVHYLFNHFKHNIYTGDTSSWTGAVWIPSGSYVTGHATFNAGVNPNTITTTIIGFLVPRIL